MRVISRPGGETRIVVSSASGRDIGLFLIYAGVVGTAPGLYIYEALQAHFVGVTNWGPAIQVGVVLALFGLLFAFNTRKVIDVKDHVVTVRDGFWRRPLKFEWQGDCAIKLRPIEQEVRHRAFETWQIKLVSQGYEYLIDARPDQQLTSRRLAESLSRGLNCSLVETDQGHQELVIESKDLDLPFADRVRKYPQVLGTSVSEPKKMSGMQHGDENGTRFYRWGLQASWLLLEIIMLAVAAFFVSFVPWNENSIFLLSVKYNNNTYYYGVLLLVVASIILLPGFRAQLLLRPESVSYRTMLWGLPLRSTTIPMHLVEEIRQHEGIRGPIVQIISDKKIIGFRVLDRDVAAWLAYEVGFYVSNQKS